MVFSGNEIVTLQFGHYSNFIGTHWWNCQEAGFHYIPDTPSEINHDVLFREGQTSRGEVTFTPRLLLVDLKGSLGCLPEEGRLYGTSPGPDTSLPLWPPDKVTVQSRASESKNEFLQDLEQGETLATSLPTELKKSGKAVPKLYHLDDSVRSWSDFLRPHLHPRNINLVQEYQHEDASLPFDTFPQGQAIWSSSRFNEEFTDRVRLYLEETDNLQGFQVLMDSYDGFSGLGCAALQHLRDEYPSKTCLCLPCQPPLATPLASHRVLNVSLALSSLAEHSSVFCPISGTTSGWRDLSKPVQLPHLQYKSDLYYHTSALVAAAVDTMSLVYRRQTGSERLADLTARLGMYGRRAVALSVGLPFPLGDGATLLDTLEQCEGPLTLPLTPLTDLQAGVWQQTLVLRGVLESQIMRPDQRDLSSSNPAYSCRSLAQLLRTFLQFNSQTAAPTQVYTAESALPTGAPFPHIFLPHISAAGHRQDTPRPLHTGVEKVPVLAGLHSCQGLGSSLETLHNEAKRINIRSLHQFSSAGLESLELLESLEQLLCLSECYSDHQMHF
uniref:Protein misato homolog 1 n=1 Tax=Graphocephala atropunctata TaxID=36148 RepID=A0A1B6LBE0_9HEMI